MQNNNSNKENTVTPPTIKQIEAEQIRINMEGMLAPKKVSTFFNLRSNFIKAQVTIRLTKIEEEDIELSRPAPNM